MHFEKAFKDLKFNFRETQKQIYERKQKKITLKRSGNNFYGGYLQRQKSMQTFL